MKLFINFFSSDVLGYSSNMRDPLGFLSDLIEDINLYGLRCKGQRFDCGSKPGLIEANISLAMDREDLRDEIANILRDFNSRI